MMFVLNETAKRVSESDSPYLGIALAVILIVGVILLARAVKEWKT